MPSVHPSPLPGVGPLLSARLPGFLPPGECAALVAALEARGFSPTTAAYPRGYRDNDRLVFDDDALAARWFAAAREALPAALEVEGTRWALAGLNRRFRACRYRGGQSFCVHRDGPWCAPDGARSWLTLQAYLNGDPRRPPFRGGATRFFAGPDGARLVHSSPAVAGDAIAFDHRAWHDGEAVTEGTKYVLRTDVLYQPADGARLASGGRGYVWAVEALADGSLVSAGRDGAVRFHGTGRAVDLGDGSVTALAAAGAQVIAGTRSGRLYRAAPDGCWERLADLGAAVVRARASEGEVALALSDGTRARWRPGAPLLRERAHAGWTFDAHALAGGALVSCGDDGRLLQGDRELLRVSGRSLRACALLGDRWVAADEAGLLHRQGAAPARLHAGAVTDLCALPGGALASAGEDGAVRVWRGGACVWERVLDDFARAVRPLPGGLAFCGYDGEVRREALD